MHHKHRTALAALVLTLGVFPAQAQSVPAPAMDETQALRDARILPPQGPAASPAQQEANKRIVLQFHYEFFDLGHYEEAAAKYLAPDFKVNDPREPSGRAAYVKFFVETEGKSPGLLTIRKPENRPKFKAVLASGDLVMIVFDRAIPWPNGPAKEYTYISCDMFRLENGKIAESWFSGTPAPPAN